MTDKTLKTGDMVKITFVHGPPPRLGCVKDVYSDTIIVSLEGHGSYGYFPSMVRKVSDEEAMLLMFEN